MKLIQNMTAQTTTFICLQVKFQFNPSRGFKATTPNTENFQNLSPFLLLKVGPSLSNYNSKTYQRNLTKLLQHKLQPLIYTQVKYQVNRFRGSGDMTQKT